jgi:SAM-dependent methyltransferase
MTARLSDSYFDDMYAAADDPWDLASRWYEQRKYAITTALLPHLRFQHAFEPGCSIGTLTQRLAQRCDHVTAVDVAEAPLRTADVRLRALGCRDNVTLAQSSLDQPWPDGPFDLVVLSEVAYYLSADLLGRVMRRECAKLTVGATVVAAHWRHAVADYPLDGDAAHQVIAETPDLARLGWYRDADVVIEVFQTGAVMSVAERDGIPGAHAASQVQVVHDARH